MKVYHQEGGISEAIHSRGMSRRKGRWKPGRAETPRMKRRANFNEWQKAKQRKQARNMRQEATKGHREGMDQEHSLRRRRAMKPRRTAGTRRSNA